MASRISWVPRAFLRAGQDRARAVEADDVFDLAAGFLGLRAGQVDLVDDRDDLEAAVHGEVRVGQRLRLHALARIHQQQRALARGQRPRDLVREVHVARRVDQVQDVLLPVIGRVVQADRVRLDGDAALALEVHGVQDLGLHLAGLERPGVFQEAVGQRGLAVVDVRDDREVPDVLLVQRLGSGRRRKAGPSLCQTGRWEWPFDGQEILRGLAERTFRVARWPFPPARALAPTRSSQPSARGAWARCIARATPS